ncbi:MAG: hypothetical protein M1416_01245 [Candidatus Pacearchaeota archaeon]|nr:hypothetical protein [Candidatus Pacearchaeota archaeon]
MQNKGGALEISFGWLFAIIAGIVIIFLAIYLSTRLIGTEQETKSAETGKEIGILLNPLETSFESAQTTSITIPVDTRINNGCELIGTFGRQTIQLDQKSFNEWTRTDINVFFNNKYIFSGERAEGKRFYIFSKPFKFPFKVADLIYMTTANEQYCFIGAPFSIEEELSNLNQANLLTENCTGSEIEVCFNNEDCDVNVDYNFGSVEKNGEVMYFDEGDDALMYAGIFSSKEIYECQLKRLMMRVKTISILYANKEIISEKEGCTEESLIGELGALSNLAESFGNSGEIGGIKSLAESIDSKNSGRRCPLW